MLIIMIVSDMYLGENSQLQGYTTTRHRNP